MAGIDIYQKRAGSIQVGTVGGKPAAASKAVAYSIEAKAQQDVKNIQALQHAGLQLAQVVAAENRRRLEADAFAAYTQLQQDSLEFESAYAEQNQGRSAANAAVDYQSFIQKRSEELSKELSGIGLQSFQKQSQSEALSSFARGTQYSRQQNRLYQEDVLKGMRVTHQQLMAARPNDFKAIANSRQNLNAALETFMPGRDHTAIQAGWEEEDASQLINQALASENVGQAKMLFGELKHKLGNSAATLQLRITNMESAQVSRANAYATKAAIAQKKALITEGYSIIRESTKGLSKTEKDSKVAQILETVKDPEVRAGMMTFYEQDEKIFELKQDAQDISLREEFLEQNQDKTYSEKILALDDIEGMSQEAKNSLVTELQGGSTYTNLNDYESLENNLSAYSTSASLRRAMDNATLTNEDRGKLESMRKSLHTGDTNTDSVVKTALSTAEKNFEALGISKENKSTLRLAYANWLNLQKEQGKTITAIEADTILRQLTATAATGKSGLLGQETNTIGLELATIPLQAQEEITQSLLSKGFSRVTPNMVVQEWNRPDNEAYRQHIQNSYLVDDLYTPPEDEETDITPASGA